MIFFKNALKQHILLKIKIPHLMNVLFDASDIFMDKIFAILIRFHYFLHKSMFNEPLSWKVSHLIRNSTHGRWLFPHSSSVCSYWSKSRHRGFCGQFLPTLPQTRVHFPFPPRKYVKIESIR